MLCNLSEKKASNRTKYGSLAASIPYIHRATINFAIHGSVVQCVLRFKSCSFSPMKSAASEIHFEPEIAKLTITFTPVAALNSTLL